MKKYNILFLVAFILLTAAPAPVFSLFREQIGYKNTENKAEYLFPDLNAENYSTWPRRFEEWFSDTLPFKTQFIELFRGFQMLCGLDYTQSDVIKGKEDFLFYRKTLENYKGLSRFSEEQLREIEQNLTGFFSHMESMGTKCLLYIAPDKEQVYPSLMPDEIQRISAQSRGDQTAEFLTSQTGYPVLYPKSQLIELSQNYPIYYNTDTHWNDLGGWVAAQQVRSAFTGEAENFEIPDFSYYESEGKDLAGMLGLTEYLPEKNAVTVEFDDDIAVWKPESIDHGTIQRFNSYAPVHKKMLLVGDSFSEYFMRSAIHNIDEILFVTYGELHRIDFESEQPDYLVVMLVERNLPFLLDGFS